MGDVIHRTCTSPNHIDYSRIGVDAKVLRYLVVCALDEGAVNRPDGTKTTLCHTACHGASLFLGNAHVDVLLACLFTLFWRKACGCRGSCCDCDECRIVLHLTEHPVAIEFFIALCTISTI